LGELLWYVTPSQHVAWTRAKPYRAPSWSWASLHAETKENKYKYVNLEWVHMNRRAGDRRTRATITDARTVGRA
jgi:hypothetical protein